MSKLLGKLLTRSFPGKPNQAFPVLNPSADDAGRNDSVDLDARGYESRAFALWLNELRRFGGDRLIDFGPMRPQSVTFFGEQQMGLSILGLDANANIAGQLEEFEPDASYDAALCWEFPNYVDPDDLKKIGSWLAAHIKPGGLVMLSLAIQTPYSELPSSYRIVDAQHLERDPAELGGGRTRRYNSGELGKYWPSFEPIRSFLLRSGMQEYVLRRRLEPGD